jgi:hypothetical protein
MEEARFWFRAYYNADANELWRNKHRKSRLPGPQPGEVAIEVWHASADARDLEADLAEARRG